jgi:hypothetical protein
VISDTAGMSKRLRSLCALALLSLGGTAEAVGLSLSPEMPLTLDGLRLAVQLEPADVVLEALEAHIELPFRIDRRCGGLHQVARISLRLRPLSQDYVLRMTDDREVSFRLRAEALAAFSSLTLPKPTACLDRAPQVRVQLELAELPAALRLPALLSGDWRLDSGWISPLTQDDGGRLR